MAVIKIFDGNITSSGTINIYGNNGGLNITGSNGNVNIYAGGTNDLLLGSGRNIYISQSTVLIESKSFGSSQFFSGFTGNGWSIDSGKSEVSKSSAEFDNLTIRGQMRVYEMIINQIRATNGSVFVSSTGKAETVIDKGSGTYVLNFNSGSGLGHGFLEDDVIRAQRFDASYNNLYRSDLLVTSAPSLYQLTASMVTSGSYSYPPSGGMDFVRLGNRTHSNRQGSVYLTADDSNAPFIDVVDGIVSHSDWNTSGKVKTRIGKLTGIRGTVNWGDLSGYGFYASGSAYLEGGINATTGKIGGFNIDSTTISSSNNAILLDSANQSISLKYLAGMSTAGIFLSGSGEFNLSDGTNYVKLSAGSLSITSNNISISGSNVQVITPSFLLGNSTTYISGSSAGIEISGSNIKLFTPTFYLGNDSTFISGSGGNIKISGSNLEMFTNKFFLGSKGSANSYISSSGNTLEISSSNFHLDTSGNITASNALLSGKVTATAGKIGGFEITSDAITGSAFYISGSGTGLATEYFISSSKFNVKGNGDVTGSNILFTGGVISGSSLSINVTTLVASGSSVEIITPKFFLGSKGSANSYISSSGNTLEISSSNFHLDTSGNITASNVKLSGDITASAGLIASWSINGPSLNVGTTFKLDGSATSAGQYTISSSNFKVDGIGNVTASNVSLSGSIYATSGYFTGTLSASDGNIGGWTINPGTLTSGNMKLSGSGVISSSKFYVDNVGNVTASNVSMSGVINASGGTIGGFTITDKAISGVGISISGSGTGVGTEYFISSSKFNIKQNGDVTGSNVLFTGGIISGFKFDSTFLSASLSSGSISISKNGSIELTKNASYRVLLDTVNALSFYNYANTVTNTITAVSLTDNSPLSYYNPPTDFNIWIGGSVVYYIQPEPDIVSNPAQIHIVYDDVKERFVASIINASSGITVPSIPLTGSTVNWIGGAFTTLNITTGNTSAYVLKGNIGVISGSDTLLLNYVNLNDGIKFSRNNSVDEYVYVQADKFSIIKKQVVIEVPAFAYTPLAAMHIKTAFGGLGGKSILIISGAGNPGITFYEDAVNSTNLYANASQSLKTDNAFTAVGQISSSAGIYGTDGTFTGTVGSTHISASGNIINPKIVYPVITIGNQGSDYTQGTFTVTIKTMDNAVVPSTFYQLHWWFTTNTTTLAPSMVGGIQTISAITTGINHGTPSQTSRNDGFTNSSSQFSVTVTNSGSAPTASLYLVVEVQGILYRSPYPISLYTGGGA